MIPEERLSTRPVPAAFYPPDDNDSFDTLRDVEMGGVALNDPSEGLRVKVWTLRADGKTGAVYISAADVGETLLFSAKGVQEVSLAFDQNMRPFVAYVQNGRAKFRWYDTLAGDNVVTELDPLDRTPRCTMDDKRPNQTASGANDIILAYVRGTSLYYRQQRERYGVEHLLSEVIPAPRLIKVGMAVNNRLQFEFF